MSNFNAIPSNISPMAITATAGQSMEPSSFTLSMNDSTITIDDNLNVVIDGEFSPVENAQELGDCLKFAITSAYMSNMNIGYDEVLKVIKLGVLDEISSMVSIDEIRDYLKLSIFEEEVTK